MSDEATVRRQIREWVVRKSGTVTPEGFSDDTPILERRLITSLQVMDLILFIEDLSGRQIDVSRLRPGVFGSVDLIWRNFFATS